MKNNMRLIVICIILMLIFSGIYIFIFKNESKIDNNSTNNVSKTNNLNKTLNSSSIDNKNNSNKYEESTKCIEKNQYSDKNKSNNTTFDSARIAKELVEKYVLNKNQIAKYPVYKERGDWLVPIFDKKTGKFVGSVFSGDDPTFLLFTNGPDSYYQYKKVISGKTIKHDSNKPVKKVNKKNTKKSIKQTKKDNKSQNKSKTNINVTNRTPALNQQSPAIESYNNINSTS